MNCNFRGVLRVNRVQIDWKWMRKRIINNENLHTRVPDVNFFITFPLLYSTSTRTVMSLNSIRRLWRCSNPPQGICLILTRISTTRLARRTSTKDCRYPFNRKICECKTTVMDQIETIKWRISKFERISTIIKTRRELLHFYYTHKFESALRFCCCYLFALFSFRSVFTSVRVQSPLASLSQILFSALFFTFRAFFVLGKI